MLLPKEVVLKDRLDANSRHELLLYRFVNWSGSLTIFTDGPLYALSLSLLGGAATCSEDFVN